MKTLFCMILAVVAVALAGCETESSDQISISISPSHASLRKGESVTFTASGWKDYTWAITDKTIGVLSTTKGSSTVYTAIKGSADSQILVVTVNIPADGINTDASTNGVVDVNSSQLVNAQAVITHNP